jgi:hypothetical protein
MAFESILSVISPPAVHAKPDVVRVNPEGQNGQERREQPKRERQEPEQGQHAHPVPNTQGQITGKLIDITA